MDTPSDMTSLTGCNPASSRPVRKTAVAARQLFRTVCGKKSRYADDESLSDSDDVSDSDNSDDVPSSDFVTASSDTESESDCRPTTSAAPSPAKRAKRNVSAAQTADAEPVSTWRVAETDEVVGTATNEDDGSGILLNLGTDRTPMGFFLALLTEDILDSLIISINEHAAIELSQTSNVKKRSRLHQWVPVGRHEMYKFLATLLAMSVQPKPRIGDYWSTKPHLHTPFFGQMFSRNQFELIYNTMLHISEADSQGRSKIEPFVNQLLASFQAAFYPYSDLIIDDMVIGYKRCWKHKQYKSRKPSKYHIKIYGLCDSITGYVFNLLVYFGFNISTRDDNPTNAVKVFDTLMEPLRSSHHIFADRFYTSLPLVEFLQSKGHNYTGTLNVTCEGFPPELKTHEVAPKEAIYHVKDGERKILCVSWRDRTAKKPVHVVTTHGQATATHVEGQEEVEKPTVIDTYNMCMNGCDRIDQMVSFYGLHTRKTVKWCKKIFTWILEVVQVNAQILYVLSEEPAREQRSLSWFKEQLIEGLRSLAASSTIPGVTMSSPKVVGRKAKAAIDNRFQGNNHLVNRAKTLLRCAYCSRPDKIVRTTFYCTACLDKPHLCPVECFEKYHQPS